MAIGSGDFGDSFVQRLSSVHYWPLHEGGPALYDRSNCYHRIDHEDFMKEYPSIFTSSRSRNRCRSRSSSSSSGSRRPTPVITRPQSRPKTLQGRRDEHRPSLGQHNIRAFLKSIHGCHVREEDKERVSLSAHLHAAMKIVRKL